MGHDRRRTRAIGALLASLLLLSLGSAGATAKDASEWHRLNPNGDRQSSEHERLTCREGATSWTCTYDKLPDAGFSWNATTGHFSGRDVTDSWTCPEWFPSEARTGVVQVLAGRRRVPAGRRTSVHRRTGIRHHPRCRSDACSRALA